MHHYTLGCRITTGLHIDRDPISGCMSSWEHFEGNDILSLFDELLGAVLGPEHRHGHFVNCYWFEETFKLGDSPT